MAAPVSFKVNGRTISLSFKAPEKMPGTAGMFNSQKSSIVIAKGQDQQELQDTVLHELFHALLHTQGREYGGEEEELYVRALATGTIGLLRDNPELVSWLSGIEPEVIQ